MEFNPNNHVVNRCLQGMSMEEKGKPEEASQLFLQAWNEATNDFEKFIAAYYVARHQKNVADKIRWLETSLQLALKIDNDTVNSSFPSLYLNIAKCYEDLGDPDKAKKNYELAALFKDKPSDRGPFYHGTRADLRIGDLLTAGGSSNYKPELKMNHIYFTAWLMVLALLLHWLKMTDENVFISLNRLAVLKMTRMLQTKDSLAIRPAHFAPKHH